MQLLLATVRMQVVENGTALGNNSQASGKNSTAVGQGAKSNS